MQNNLELNKVRIKSRDASTDVAIRLDIIPPGGFDTISVDFVINLAYLCTWSAGLAGGLRDIKTRARRDHKHSPSSEQEDI